jgi:hypothetical protein
MSSNLSVDDDLVAEVGKTAELIHEKPSTVLRLAIRAGLPLVAQHFQGPRPEGYFAEDYPLPDEVLALEAAMVKVPIGPDR